VLFEYVLCFPEILSKMNEENFYMIQNNIHAKSVF